MTVSPTDPVDRRTLLRGVAAGGGLAAALVLTGCGEDEEPAASSSSSSEPGGSAEPLGSTSEVEVGSATIFTDAAVVVSQPTGGEFKGFSTTCTHKGCLVDSVEGDEIVCPCHGSRYSITDGSVVGGPAPAPLEEMAVSVKGDQLVLG